MEEHTVKDNPLISEFMKLPLVKNNSLDKLYIHTDLDGNEWGYEPENLEYHKSWDWLVPVCQKIKKLQTIKIPSNGVEDSIYPHLTKIRKMSKGAINFDLDMTYQGVVEFIKWYNQNKPPQNISSPRTENSQYIKREN